MELISQKSVIEELTNLAEHNRHSIMIVGPHGSGKTHLAKMYASMLGIDDFLEISPKVEEVRRAIDTCIDLNTPVVMCIENLDKGVLSAAYTLLKFLEEPSDNAYIIITARNITKVPDTIISRSTVTITSPPTDVDIAEYAKLKNLSRYQSLCNNRIWKCVRSFADADMVLNLSGPQLQFFDDLSSKLKFQDTITNMSWNFGHYPDNTETPIEFVIRYIMELVDTRHARLAGVSCIRDISSGRIAKHAALSKFLFEMKYTE